MTELAKRYGGSLYDLAAEEALEPALMTDLDCAVDCFKQQPAYLRLLSTPSISKKERCALLDEAFGAALHPYVVNFCKLLCEQGALRELTGCAQEYRRRYNEAHGIVEATAVSAVPLSEDARQKLREKLEAMTGKTIQLTTKTDPTLLGGLRIDMQGQQLDGSLRQRLQTLRTGLAGSTL